MTTFHFVAQQHIPVLQLYHSFDLIRAVTDSIQTSDNRPHTGPSHDIDRYTGFLQHFQYPDMRHTFAPPPPNTTATFLRSPAIPGQASKHISKRDRYFFIITIPFLVVIHRYILLRADSYQSLLLHNEYLIYIQWQRYILLSPHAIKGLKNIACAVYFPTNNSSNQIYSFISKPYATLAATVWHSVHRNSCRPVVIFRLPVFRAKHHWCRK